MLGGQVAALDTRRKLGGFWPAWWLKWWPKNYEICFVQRGLGAWELTYAENWLEDQKVAVQTAQSVAFLRMEGPSIAVLEAKLHLRVFFGAEIPK